MDKIYVGMLIIGTIGYLFFSWTNNIKLLIMSVYLMLAVTIMMKSSEIIDNIKGVNINILEVRHIMQDSNIKCNCKRGIK